MKVNTPPEGDAEALYARIDAFTPLSPEEERDKAALLSLIREFGTKILDRSCEAGHITCSGFILSPDGQKTLMAYHLIYQSVGWTGGHADGDPDLPGVALREAKEETSAKYIWLFSGKILSIDRLPVPAHQKNGRFVPSHLHYNVTYGLIAREDQPLADKPDENRGVQWIPIHEIASRCSEKHMLPIYAKLLKRMEERTWQKKTVLERMVSPLLAWYPDHHRDLPWRRDTEPYHVWVSEIMLQQTRTETVAGYYSRFLEALPDVASLAACPEDRLMKLWEGLGYYSRARHMREAAQVLVQDYGGRFPRDFASLRALPGIGEYTAGAIGSICFGLPVPAVDGNVLRVAARLREDFRNVLEDTVKKEVTQILTEIYPTADAAALTQSLMELGETVCTPGGAPRCPVCPLRALCLSYDAGTEKQLPIREKHLSRRTEKRTILILRCEGRTAIRQRPPKGLLAGLWELPGADGFLTPSDAINLAAAWGTKPVALEKTVERTHRFTHITWELQGVFLRCAAMPDDFVWADEKSLAETYSLPTAFRCLFT